MTHAERLERYANNLIESTLKGSLPNECEDEGQDILDWLRLYDPPTKFRVWQWTCDSNKRGLRQVTLLTDGGREVGTYSEHYMTPLFDALRWYGIEPSRSMFEAKPRTEPYLI